LRDDGAVVPVVFGILLIITWGLYQFDPGLAKVLAVFDGLAFVVLILLVSARSGDAPARREPSSASKWDEEDQPGANDNAEADPQSASDAFAEALAVDPMSAGARGGLAQARSVLAGNPR
jgi:hypothetical protein